MQERKSITSAPMLVGIALSLAVHAAAFYGRGRYTPAKPVVLPGRTVVQLTLVPSIASTPATPVALPMEHHEPPPPEPRAEQAPQPALPVAEPVAKPLQAPSIEPPTPAPEQDGSLAEEKGTSLDAQPFKAVNPVYPRLSRRRGEEGTVTLAIEVLASGKTGAVKVLASSGHKRLDQAALQAAQQTAFTPANQFGRSIDSNTELSYTFRLTDD